MVQDGAEEMQSFWLELGQIEQESYTARQLTDPERVSSPPFQPCRALGSLRKSRSSSRQGSARSTPDASPGLHAQQDARDTSPWNSSPSLQGLHHTSLHSASPSPLLSPRLESPKLDELYESIQNFKLQSLHHLACAKQRVEQTRNSIDEVRRSCSPEGDEESLPESDHANHRS